MTIRKIRKEENVCLYCGNTLDRDGINCSICNEQYNEWKRDYVNKCHEEGKCSNCGNALDRQGWLCKKCVNKANAHARERNAFRRENGLCVQCAKPTEGYSQCRECLDKLADRRNKNKGGNK